MFKEDVTRVFHDFLTRNKFEKSLNATFLALIPKKLGVVDVNDFRPISLVSGVYKIIAKVLANRLKRIKRRLFQSPKMRLSKVGKF